MMSSAMSSAQIFVLVLIAVLHVLVQAENGRVETSTVGTHSKAEELQKTGDSTESEENAKLSHDEKNLSELIAKYVNEWDTYYNAPKSKRAPRTKRWAEMEKRPAYVNTYMPSRSYSRYQYPSNLMALLRGTKRGFAVEPSPGRWQYPSNLMVLLRGKKSADDDEEEEEEELEEEQPDYQREAAEEVMKRIADGWRYFLETYSPDMPPKRSAFYGYGNDRSDDYTARRPFGARQFMVWNGGRYIIG